MCRDSSAGAETGYELEYWSSIPNKRKIPLYSIASGQALRPTQPHIQWVPGALSSRVKLLRSEADI
jgi:hypothetical protein